MVRLHHRTYQMFDLGWHVLLVLQPYPLTIAPTMKRAAGNCSTLEKGGLVFLTIYYPPSNEALVRIHLKPIEALGSNPGPG